MKVEPLEALFSSRNSKGEAMSFAEDVKNELCQFKTEDAWASKVEASCLLRMGGSILLGMQGRVGVRLVTANNAVARRVLGIIKEQYDLPTSVLVRKGLNLRKKNMYTLTVEPTEPSRLALEDLQLWPVDAMIPDAWLKDMESRRAFLRGAFLGCGSVNKPQSDYHLEFMTTKENFADQIIRVLKMFRLNARKVERKEEFVVYLKEGDAVTSCLQIMGAQSALMNFENVRIMKDVRNTINRQVNCETANLQKTVNAAVRQLDAIRIIDKHQGLDSLPIRLYEAAILRQEFPDGSLQELVDAYETKYKRELTKSGIGHRLRKLEAIALQWEPDGLTIE